MARIVKKLTVLMFVAAVVMAVAAGALFAAVRYATDAAPEIVDSVVGSVESSVNDAVAGALDDNLADALEQVDTNSSSDMAPAALPASTSTTIVFEPDGLAIGPAARTAMTVVGVRWDDVLNLRDAPNGNIVARLRPYLGGARDAEIDVLAPDSDTVVSIAPLSGVIAMGATRELQTTTWHEVSVGGLTGWASDAYLAHDGGPATDLADLLERHLDNAENYDDFSDIEDVIKQVIDTVEPDAELAAVSIGGFHEGDGDLMMDVLGVRDDRLRGYRVRVWVRAGGDWMVPNPVETAGPFTVTGVNASELCLNIRGPDAEGNCR